MTDDKNFFAGLFDFSFNYSLLRRLVKLLYIISLLGGGIALVKILKERGLQFSDCSPVVLCLSVKRSRLTKSLRHRRANRLRGDSSGVRSG